MAKIETEFTRMIDVAYPIIAAELQKPKRSENNAKKNPGCNR
jgi:hypothetical protein